MGVTQMKEDYESEIVSLFREAEQLLEKAKEKLQRFYSEHGLGWSKESIRGLKGDIYAKVLGKYLEKKTKKKAQYEKTISGRIRADILLDKVEVESKVQGIFDLNIFERRWKRVNEKRPDLVHLVVGWRHNPIWAEKVRKVVGENNHFMLFNVKSKQHIPSELKRLVVTIKQEGSS